MNENKKWEIELVKWSSLIITGGAAGAIGSLGGPGLGAVGGVLGNVLSTICGDYVSRRLAPRQEARVGACVVYAAQKMKTRLEAGNRVRSDDFFKKDSSDRSAADEFVEGILIASEKTYEEKKLIYLGNLIANIAFEERINRDYANLLLKISQEISYTQIRLLKLCCSQNKLRDEDYANGYPAGVKYYIQQFYDLYQRSLTVHGEAIGHASWIKPQKVGLSEIGEDLVLLMEIRNMPDQEIEEIINALNF